MTIESSDMAMSHDSQSAASAEAVEEADSERQMAARSHFWLTDRDQWLVAVLSTLSVIALGIRYFQYSYVDRSSVVLKRPSEDIGYRIDLNSATWIELTQLRGIGDTFAKRIVEDRENNGPFKSIDDLQRVHGIGPKTVEKNRRWLQIAGARIASDRDSGN